MATSYEAAYHVGQARLRGGLPSTDARFTDAKLLKLLTDELQGNIAPLVHNAKAEHGVVQYTVSATVGQASYQLPTNAFASTLRDVYWIDASGAITPLEPRSAADPLMYALARNNGTPRYYYLRGSRVSVVPPPAATGTLALPHYARPNQLVLVANAVVVSGASNVGSAWTLQFVGTPPAGLDTAGVVQVDVIRSTPGFETIMSGSCLITGGPGPGVYTYEVTSTETIVEGDYICLPGESPVPQCPVELFPLLHARAALVAVPSTGDMSQASAALAAQVADLEAKARAFLQPRVESGSPPPGKGLGTNPLLGVVSGSWSGY